MQEYLTYMQDADFRKAFGTRVRNLRKQHNWTQKDLAKKLDILFSQLNKYECGINVPPAEKLVEMAEIFHTSVDYLLKGEQSEQTSLRNTRLLERFRDLEKFNADDQETIIKLIDAMIIKQKMEEMLKPVEKRSKKAS